MGLTHILFQLSSKINHLFFMEIRFFKYFFSYIYIYINIDIEGVYEYKLYFKILVTNYLAAYRI